MTDSFNVEGVVKRGGGGGGGVGLGGVDLGPVSGKFLKEMAIPGSLENTAGVWT